jgi:3-hydroxybutyryl-CoA dehydratase
MTSVRAGDTLIVDRTTPSRTLTLADLVLGDAVVETIAFTADHRAAFATLADDRAPVHEDARFAAAQGFTGTILQGLCVSTRFSRLIGMYLPGERAILAAVDLEYRRPTYEDQPLTFRAEVTRLLPAMKIVRLGLTATSNAGIHISGEAQCVIR